MVSLEAIAYPLASVVVVLFGVFACAYQYMRQRKQGGDDTAEFFLTARNSVPTFTIAWSFYAGAMGSWALFGPPSYALYGGVIGVCTYALSSGIPIIIIAFFGDAVQRQVPHVLSLADFVNRRFGRVVSLYVAALMLFNMGVALTAEYTAVGDLFKYVIGSSRVAIVVIIGVVSMLYTAWGGLYVSIITDQWQALTSVVVICIVFIFVWSTFDEDLPPIPKYLGSSNYTGLSSIAVLPISLISATIYSEAMWQRCFASANGRSLKTGAVIGAVAVIIAVFLFGFGGFLAVWGNVWVPAGPDDTGNTILFALLRGKKWVIVLVSILAVTMSESAIDSLQNAIVDTMGVAVIAPFVRIDLLWIRILVLALNVPPMVVSLQGYNILQLFLLANLITTTSTIPLLLGLVRGRAVQRIVTPFSMLSGCALGLASIFAWAEIHRPADVSYSQYLHDTFLVAYDYPPFLLALGFSVVGMAIGAALEFAFRALVPAFREYPFYDVSAPPTLPLVDGVEMEGKEGAGGAGGAMYKGQDVSHLDAAAAE